MTASRRVRASRAGSPGRDRGGNPGGAGGGGDPAGPITDAAEDLRLARLHLRLGMHASARAELEDLGGRGALDLDGVAALAEARWRTGDPDGAADAADAHLAAGGGDPVAIVIAAEAAALAGEGADARALMARIGKADAMTIDAIFAGIPRRAHWPTAISGATSSAQPTAAQPTAAQRGAGQRPAAQPAGEQPAATSGSGMRAGRASAVPGPVDVIQSSASLWGDAAPAGTAAAGGARSRSARAPRAGQVWTEPARAKGQADPDAELERARDELDQAPERGLVRLALVLRLDPALAPDVLDAVRLRREPAAVLLRGDAERLLGRHLEAEAAFADAIELIERQAMAGHAPPPSGHHGPADRQEDT